MATKTAVTITEALHHKSDAELKAEIAVAVDQAFRLFGSYAYSTKLPAKNDFTVGDALKAIGELAFAQSSESRRAAAVAAFMAKVEELDAMQRYPEGE